MTTTIVIQLDKNHVSVLIKDKDGKLKDEIEGTKPAAMEQAVVALVLDTYREATR